MNCAFCDSSMKCGIHVEHIKISGYTISHFALDVKFINVMAQYHSYLVSLELCVY